MLENVRILLQALTDIRAEITRKEGGNPTDLPSLHYIMKRSPGIRDGQPTPRAICGAGWCTKSRCAGTKRRVDTYAHTAILSRQAHLRRASKSSIAAYRLSCGCALKKSIMALAITVRIMRICFSRFHLSRCSVPVAWLGNFASPTSTPPTMPIRDGWPSPRKPSTCAGPVHVDSTQYSVVARRSRCLWTWSPSESTSREATAILLAPRSEAARSC